MRLSEVVNKAFDRKIKNEALRCLEFCLSNDCHITAFSRKRSSERFFFGNSTVSVCLGESVKRNKALCLLAVFRKPLEAFLSADEGKHSPQANSDWVPVVVVA